MLFRPTAACYKNLKASSKTWVARQFRDPYVKKRLSDPAAYRSRSAFKLLEIDAEWDHFLQKPDVRAVVDLGAAPGGWSQVVAGKLGWGAEASKLPSGGYAYGVKSELEMEKKGTWSSPKSVSHQEVFDPLNIDALKEFTPSAGRGTIVAVDLLRMQPIHGVHAIQADFLSPEAADRIHELLSVKGNLEGKADIILSDMAGNASGNDTHDIESSLEICEAVYEFARRNLRSAEDVGRRRGGVLLMKHFEHPLLQKFRMEKLQPNFNDVKYIKPEASRSASREGYFLCQGWRAIDI
ncbi:ribosomal RNA methyltransferase FtsJ domain-containing protein [Crucibulum laeve]|uniref:rRNA methyltransferase 2, mitochondrial n=1 Tax=Crucibulum laeve TaxID=68775 RepID=A0A5C3LU30_9AGAR|nr:ribosomal RNA methyltransferase FtsJ domain-containing protein [Crucibulum laeve]